MPNSLQPQGPAAANIAELWWLMFALGAVIFVLILGILIWIAFRRSTTDRVEGHGPLDDPRGVQWIRLGGIVMPAIVLAVVFGFTIRSLAALQEAEAADMLTIHVYGRRWWWEVQYRDHGIITANEIHIPTNVPVQIVLTATDVIHSFWVPELHGKMDAIPGRTNTLQIQADREGQFRGLCAEFCGTQHARMGFYVVAQSEEDFQGWLSHQQQLASAPVDEVAVRGQEVFLQSDCAYCHTIRGVNEGNNLGPDLTHLATRLTLGAGSRPNNRGNLAGWIVNAQHVKPGNLMPPQSLSGEDLQSLLAYLETLE